ncbi:PIN-like domain-containing protein [Owenweeksia hongkongensis]|uniref:PIN-like domain-containing protein n=1 Tax=Owenweeksia hongkongensis TaxID=253245 RepID=UPI003A8EFF11
MKDFFPGYSRKSELEIKEIWQNGIIMFDTNVLLNLYRYSKSTRETIVTLIGKFKSQIWLPHQAALEYNKNRYEVIADQEKTYKEFTEKIIQIQKDLQSSSKPPFLSEKVHEKLNNVFEKVNSEVEESIKKYCDYLKDDPIYSGLGKLFENRITESFDEGQLEEIFKEGEERFKNKVPPGYEDEKNKTGNRKYGDLVLWKQVIAKAKELGKPVLLVTDERKNDWWWKIKDGRNMGPRHELVSEIKNEAQVDFHMYSSERFLSYGQTFLEEQINEKALKEILAMKKAEMEHLMHLERKQERDKERNVVMRKKIPFLRLKYEDLSSRINEIDQQQNDLMLDAQDNVEVQEYIHNLSIRKAEMEQEIEHIKGQMIKYNFRFDTSEGDLDRRKERDYEKLFEYTKRRKE